jgi:hypothetical protein
VVRLPQGEVTCSRCHEVIPGSKLPDGTMTAGYYVVEPGSGWQEYAKPGEQYLCDGCMWADPRYIAVYGKHPMTQTRAKQLGFVPVSSLGSSPISLTKQADKQ